MNYPKTFSLLILIAWRALFVISVISFITPNISEAQLFNPAVNYDASEAPYSVAIGDLNGDGDLDLAVANQDSDNISVLLGNGDGSFQSAVNYGVGVGPQSVAIGDLNEDGDLDLAVANRNSNNVSVLLGNGDGSFQSAVYYHDSESPKSVAIGDLNGDANPDLAIANYGENNVSVLLGNGDGSFQSAVYYDAGYASTSVAIGDLNGDTNPDIVVTNYGYGPALQEVAVLLGNGDGSFQSAVYYRVGLGPLSVAIGDLNGDPNPDLAVASQDSGNVSVLLGNGDGSFQNALSYDINALPRSVAIGDLNGDGKKDLAVATRGGHIEDQGYVSVLLGNGDGSFQDEVYYDTGKWSNSVAIGDLNGDGDLDLAVANYMSDDISILINKGPSLLYMPVTPCRIADTRKSGGIIGAFTQRNFRVFGSGGTISAQGGNPYGCPSPLGQPLAAHINMVAVNPTGKGNLQAFPVGAGTGAGLSVNYNTIDTNLANAGTVKTVTGCRPGYHGGF